MFRGLNGGSFLSAFRDYIHFYMTMPMQDHAHADAATRHFQEAYRQLPLIATGNEGGRARARRDFCSCMVEARHRLHAFKQNASPWLVQTEWHIRDLQHDADRMGAFEYF